MLMLVWFDIGYGGEWSRCLICLLGSLGVLLYGKELAFVPAYFSCIPNLLSCLVRHRPGAWQNPEGGSCGRA